ncbi:MAG: DUF2380 domain-containing protein, partial [Gemmatimonadota bacterium]
MTELVFALVAASGLAGPATSAPAVEPPPVGPPGETVLVLDFEVRDQGVNTRDDDEVRTLAGEATRLFREEVERRGSFELVGEPGGGTSPADDDATPASECRTSECLREAAQRAGATHVIRGRYVKLSNLIRYLSVELIDASDGRVVRRSTAELKGQRDALLTRAVEVLHDRLDPA